MDLFNKLSYNLQEKILNKIFKQQKINHNLLIQQIKNISSIYEDIESIDPYLITCDNINIYNDNNQSDTNYMIEKCDFCNCIGSIRKNKEIPYYNTFLYKKLIYKTYKLYTKFYNMKYIEHAKQSYRCSWSDSFMCYSCYYGVNKSVSTQFYCSI